MTDIELKYNMRNRSSIVKKKKTNTPIFSARDSKKRGAPFRDGVAG